jgi:hypothetical protein
MKDLLRAKDLTQAELSTETAVVGGTPARSGRLTGAAAAP